MFILKYLSFIKNIMYLIYRMLAYDKSKMPGMADPNAIFAPFIDKCGKLWHPNDISIRTRDLDVWRGYNRIQPMTAVTAGLLSTQEIDFQLGAFLSTGYLDEIFIEITIGEGGVGSTQFNPYNLFQHIDVQDLTGALWKQIFPDEFFLSQMFHRDTDKAYRYNSFDKLDMTFSPLNPTLAKSGSYQFVLRLPIFTNQFVDLRLLKSPLMLRCYLNNAASICYSGSASTNINILGINLLVKEIQLPSLKYNKPLYFKYHNWVRNVQNINLQPNTTYDIKLNTFTGNPKYMFALLRLSPTSNNANNLFDFSQGIHFNSIQLNDSNSNIIGIPFNINENKYITSQDFNSLFLVQPNTNVVIFNFALDANSGPSSYTGGYQFTSNEFFHFTTDSTLVSNNFELTIWATNQELFVIGTDGGFTYTR